ncbi:MAG: flippase-like domain-containing protein [Aquificaceae bacterium]
MRRLFPFALTLLFLAFLFYFIPFEDLLKSLQKINLLNLSLAFLFYSFSQVLRSLRWKMLIKDLSLSQIFLVNSANIMFNNLLPARTGELSWFYYLKQLKVNLSLSLWTFFIGRLYDLFSLFFLLFLSLSLLKLTMLLPSLLLFSVALSFPWLYLIIPPWGRLKDLKGFIKDNTSFSLVFAIFLLSILSSATKFISLLLLLNLGHISLYKSFLAFLGGELSSVLPIHSFMGFGTYELAFGLPLKVIGESLKEWLKLGFLFHSFLLISSLVWGIPSALILSARKGFFF